MRLVGLALAGVMLAAASPAAGPAGDDGSLAEVMQRGLALLAAGDVAAAEAVFADIVAIDPGHGPARLQLGRLALERGDLRAARPHLETAAAAELHRPHLGWHLLGRLEWLDRRPEAAVDAFGRAIEAAGGFAPALVGRARARLLLDDLPRAIDDLVPATRLAPDPETSLLLAEALWAAGRTAEARRLLAGMTSASGTPAVEAQLLLWAVDGGRAAERSLRHRLGADFQLARGHLALALLELGRERPEAAATPLGVATETDDEDPVAWLLAVRSGLARPDAYPPFVPHLGASVEAAAALLEADPRAARERAEAVLQQRPWHAGAALVAVRAAEAEGDRWAALAGYRRLLDWAPGLPTLLARGATVARSMGALELAACMARAAVAALPGDGRLLALAGSIEAERGDFTAATATLSAAVEAGADDAPTHAALARARLESMQVAAALDSYDRALELDPTVVGAMPAFAVASLSAADEERLERFLSRYLESHPSDAEALYGAGVLALRSGDLDAARARLEAASTVAPDDARIHYNLAQVHRRLGDREAATAALQRFEALEAQAAAEWERHAAAHRTRLAAEDSAAAGDLDAALAGYAELVTSGLATNADFVTAGHLCLELHRPGDAADWFRRVLDADPYERRAIGGLATAAEAMGRLEDSQSLRRREAILEPPCDEALAAGSTTTRPEG